MRNYKPTRFSEELIARIRGIIARYDVNQAELAILCQVSQSQFSKMIRGVRPTSIDQLAVIGAALEIDLGALISEVENFVMAEGTWSSPVGLVADYRKLEQPYVPELERLDEWGQQARAAYEESPFRSALPQDATITPLNVGRDEEDALDDYEQKAARETDPDRGEDHFD